MPNVTQPVKAIDPTTAYYGQNPVKKVGAIDRAVGKSFENGHANLLNEGEEETTKSSRMGSMKRRLGLLK